MIYPEVIIRCMTYNHEPYIRQCLDGFLMQKTNFPFAAIVIDDSSTDNEQRILWSFINDELNTSTAQRDETNEYIKITANHKTNQNCTFVFLLLKYNHYKKKPKRMYYRNWVDAAKYIAICEGDDYWTDPYKLQKQVDFLENHHEYVICTHDYIKYFENQKKFDENSMNKSFFDNEVTKESLYYEFTLDNYFNHWFTQPLTVLHRNGEYLKTIPRQQYKYFRDDIYYYYVLKEGKGALLKDVMGVYRINDGGIWSTRNDVQKWKDSIYNAYNIYLVEGDERAFTKIERLEKQVVNYYLRSLDLVNVAHEMNNYRKMVPHKLFFSLVFSMKSMVLSLFKQGIRKLLHIVIK